VAYRFNGSARTLAQGLGWFSIGLGLAELLAPRSIARALGMEERTGLIRAYGAREVAAGVGILTQKDPTPWVWGRVAGDALDLATLAGGLDRRNPRRGNVGIALAAVAGVTILDALCARALGTEREEEQRRRRKPLRDYSHRSGLPRPPEAMRGAARDLDVPTDMRTPEALRPYGRA
jgi:hypothetical protein